MTVSGGKAFRTFMVCKLTVMTWPMRRFAVDVEAGE
jgi:hypothetical protein